MVRLTLGKLSKGGCPPSPASAAFFWGSDRRWDWRSERHPSRPDGGGVSMKAQQHELVQLGLTPS